MAVRLRGLFVLFVRSRGIVEQQAIDMNRYMHIQDLVCSKCMEFVFQEIARAKLQTQSEPGSFHRASHLAVRPPTTRCTRRRERKTSFPDYHYRESAVGSRRVWSVTLHLTDARMARHVVDSFKKPCWRKGSNSWTIFKGSTPRSSPTVSWKGVLPGYSSSERLTVSRLPFVLGQT